MSKPAGKHFRHNVVEESDDTTEINQSRRKFLASLAGVTVAAVGVGLPNAGDVSVANGPSYNSGSYGG